MFEVTVEMSFAAGHALRNYKGKCENVHGHNYRLEITLQGEQLDSAGLLMDFGDLKRSMGAAVERLDHRFINEIPPFDELNPSAENMAKYFYDQVSQGLGEVEVAVRIAKVKVWETDTSSATYWP